MPIRLTVVDAHTLIRYGLRELLSPARWPGRPAALAS